MQPIRVTIDVDPQKVPDLVCSDYSAKGGNSDRQIALALAEALGIEEYLSQPERIYELRRWMWERGTRLAAQPAIADAVLLELTAD